VSYPDYLGEPAKLPGRGEPARPARIRDWPHSEWLAVAAVCFGAITSSLDTGVVTIAYPKLGHELHRPLSQIAWLVLASQLTVVATLVLFGKRADTVGRKRVYIDGFILFLAGAIACALAPNFAFLIGARIVEALGVAMIQANSVALVASSVRENHRATALGIQASAQAIGLATGPFLGGLLVGVLGWRMIFLVSTPLAALALIASIVFLPRSRTSAAAGPLNVAGAVVLALAAGGLIGGLSIAAKHGWRGSTLGLVAIGIVAAIALVPVERHAPSPLFDRALLAHRAVRRSLLAVLITWVTFFGLLTAVPFFVERVLGRSTSSGGVITMAIPAGLIVMAPLIGRVRRRVSVAVIARFATAIVALGTVGSALSNNVWLLVGALVVVGLGIGASNTSNTTTIMEHVSEQERGVGSGLINLARAGGSALGVALASTVIELGSHQDVRAALWALVGTSALSVIVAWAPQRR
jgi:MFS family permease